MHGKNSINHSFSRDQSPTQSQKRSPYQSQKRSIISKHSDRASLPPRNKQKAKYYKDLYLISGNTNEQEEASFIKFDNATLENGQLVQNEIREEMKKLRGENSGSIKRIVKGESEKDQDSDIDLEDFKIDLNQKNEGIKVDLNQNSDQIIKSFQTQLQKNL